MLHSRSLRSTLRITVQATVVLALSATLVYAHDFWIVPITFRVAAGSTMEVHGETGIQFPTSQSAVAADRVAEARAIGAKDDERITDLSVSEKSLVIRHRPAGAGQRVVAVALVPRTTRVAGASLKRYIGLEGAPELAERYERDGVFAKIDSATQRSQKFAKTVVEIGDRGPRAFSRLAGHALELVPATDPSALHAGESFGVRLLFHGQPVANAYLRAGMASTAASADTASAKRADTTIVTGADGVALLPVRDAGLWNVRTLYAAPVTASTTNEWEVFFATLVFEVASGNGRNESRGEVSLSRSPADDSADVAAVLTRFHTALASGDSAAALALLADDVVILESGGVETRDDYRAHHLPADIEFARAVPSQQGPVRVRIRGDAAWANATGVTQGEFRGRQINSSSAELMVLSRERGGWKIRAIHWSSRARRQQ